MEPGTSIKTLEQMRNFVLGHARSLVSDADADEHGIFFCADGDSAAGRCVLDSVVENVIQSFGSPLPVKAGEDVIFLPGAVKSDVFLIHFDSTRSCASARRGARGWISGLSCMVPDSSREIFTRE